MKVKRESGFKKRADFSILQGRDYIKYNIKEKIDNLITQKNISAEIMLEEINKLPDVGFIKVMKQMVQLLYDNGQLNEHNLVAVTSKENSDNDSIYTRLTHLNTANLLTQENIDWALTPHDAYAMQTSEIKILAMNNQLTEKNLQAYKSGKIKELFFCQFVTSPTRPEEAVLNSKIGDRIYDCGQASATLGFNTFEPTLNIKPRLEVINDPINKMVATNEVSPFSALLTFTFLLQIFKGANFFPNSFKNAPDPESDPLTKIEKNLHEAFKKYRDMSEKMDEELPDEKVSSPGLHKSSFFWRDKGEEKTQLETATSPKPSR